MLKLAIEKLIVLDSGLNFCVLSGGGGLEIKTVILSKLLKHQGDGVS